MPCLYILTISIFREFRGQLVTMNVVMVTGGQVIAYCTSALLSSAEHGWRIMFALAAIPPIIQMIGMPWLPESPRYLLRRRGHTLAENRMAARRVLLRVYTSAPVRFGRYQRISTSECAPIRAEQSEAIVALVESELAAIEYAASQTANTTYADLFKYRRSLFIACGLQAFQQLCGFNTAMYYAATILRMGGFHEKENAVKFSIFIAATNMVMTLVALRYIDRVGRRRMLLYTVAAMAVGLMLLGWAFALLLGLHTFQPNCADYTTCGACVADDRCAFAIDRCLRRDQVLLPDSLIVNVDEDLPRGTLQCTGTDAGSWLALAALIFYVAAYALGLGNIPWLIQSELFPLALRGRASGIATSVNWSCNLLVAVTFLSLTHAITAAGTFWLYGSLAIVGWWFVWRYVPETAGRTLEELSEHCITMERRGQTIESP
jgi:SP family myo-inositol transporter-like MFS transporter 13